MFSHRTLQTLVAIKTLPCKMVMHLCTVTWGFDEGFDYSGHLQLLISPLSVSDKDL